MRDKLLRRFVVPAALTLVSGSAMAQTAIPAPAGPASWQSTISLSAQFDGGIMFNPAGPDNGINFGHLFTDRANQLVLNQGLLTAQRPIDPKADHVDIGFQFQFLGGTDARYTHFLGELDRAVTQSRYQIDIVAANIQVHLPYLFSGGFDVTIGQYPTLLGYETIDPSTNPFYSHSYIFNFGLPFKHTGGYAIAHVTPILDLYFGGDSGTNVTIGGGDNNSAPAAMGGFKLTLLGGNLTVLALTHIGPENPSLSTPNADSFIRSYNDITIGYKASDALTLTTELNWVRDALLKANGIGVAQYVSYALTKTLTFNARAEYFRDDNGFFVAGFTQPLDVVNVLAGRPAPGVVSFGPGTYGELTLGVTYKPDVPKPIQNLLIRPEIRWDHAFSNNHPYNSGKDANAFTLGGDLLIAF